jgi:hypothetical protein
VKPVIGSDSRPIFDNRSKPMPTGREVFAQAWIPKRTKTQSSLGEGSSRGARSRGMGD